MEISGTRESEDRIAVLEMKLLGMEALVRGLIAELLDFKAIAMSMTRENGERDRALNRETIVQGPIYPARAGQPAYPSEAVSPGDNTVIRTNSTHQPDLTVAPPVPEMVRIMQSDGTMKMESRYGEAKHIDSSGGYGRNRKDNSAASRH